MSGASRRDDESDYLAASTEEQVGHRPKAEATPVVSSALARKALGVSGAAVPERERVRVTGAEALTSGSDELLSENHDDNDDDDDDDDEDYVECQAKRRRPARSRAQSAGARRRRSSKDHACTYPGCTKVFKSNSDLAAHKRTHTGEKPLECRYEGCNAAFAHSSNRRQHERSKHEKVKRYHCRFPGCKKEYAHPTSRNDHEAVKHRNERPYKCDRCGADFTARANLSRHKSGGDCEG
ncbi:hypothetical protein FNF28_01464 [Cafeteria roenbergensis]|uniref:C2H2-type domain-containing protein n=1 Tax=Cafeteria roenbergensis TaxID=33653 RepID=A0A5A8E338_CAFRO|nr:hypothetical protein FNF28_01464 [Cafeteria roenbergensis]